MSDKKHLNMTRRSFLKASGATGAALTFSHPVKLFAAPRSAMLRTELDITRDPLAATNFNGSLLNFAQVSDVHITDTTNPLRAKAFNAIAAPAQRPQEHLSPSTWDGIVRDVNGAIEEQKLSFLISTGDQIDNAMEHEIEWFIKVADGENLPESYTRLVGTTPNSDSPDLPVPAFTPQGLALDWYAAVGNHDVMIIGNFNAHFVEKALGPLIKLMSKKEDHPEWKFNITELDEVLDKYKDSATSPEWHGFLGMPEKTRDGYYSFSPNEHIRCIVLNTTNDNWLEGMSDRYVAQNQSRLQTMATRRGMDGDIDEVVDAYLEDVFADFTDWVQQEAVREGLAADQASARGLFDWNDGVIGGLSEGTLDKIQHQWLKDEIEAHPDKLCLVFSHHGPDSFLSPAGNINGKEFINTLQGYGNVIGHIHGHTHYNLIEPSFNVDYRGLGHVQDNGGYWDITTNSLAEYPMEWRRFSIVDNGDGSGRICCRMQAPENPTKDYHDAFVAAKNDDMKKDKMATMYGAAKDRDVDLEFAMPKAVAENIVKNPPRPEDTGITAEDLADDKPAPAVLTDDSNDQRCFVATAAFGTSLEPEVTWLRRWRDEKLRPTVPGRMFIRTYYRMSPPVARYIARHETARSLTRTLLTPLIRLIKITHRV